MTTADAIIWLVLAIIPTALTWAMFHSRSSMLGFPTAIFWMVLGGYAYQNFTTPWVDWQYYVMLASLLGMVPFTIYASFGLREKRDSIADEEMEEGEGEYIDEEKGEEPEHPTLRSRSQRRRAKTGRKLRR